ncbi:MULTISPECIES: lipopolysaccharide biosynthesis protein [Gordonia]|uniref:Polysaccharide biosynthesis protein n=2 Tax=Gordonia TaxID=2053 RepID=A0A9X3D592_9ACTN|nr:MULTISPECIES: polysaccharide biosynthesis protein [Gordonia]MCF3937404.1 polysaccharide biosynthesis protein [Gordonia tangerina]MCX2965151.1 polysaccharide biosynthesis protein [Gordonia aquimaris]
MLNRSTNTANRVTANRLVVNAGALMISSLATGLLGLVYWVVAGRCFPAAAVGQASAVVSTATALASLSCLSLGGAFQRFLPIAGDRSARLVAGGYAIVCTAAVVLGTGFVLTGFGDRILLTTVERATFPLVVIVFALYALTDPILTGLRRAPAVATKNITLSVIKIVPLFLLAGSGSALSITGSWTVLAAVITTAFVFHAVRHAAARRGERGDQLPPAREMLAFQGAFFTMTLVSSTTPLVVPLIVVHELGTTANAYFNLAWTMCTAAGLLRSAVGSAFVVEASQPSADRPALLRHLRRMLTGVTALTVVGVAIGGPIVLLLAGREYVESAGWLMVIMAGTAVVETVVLTYFLIAQLQRRMRLMLITQIVMVIVTVGGAFVLIGPLGLTGVGLASLSSATVALALVARPLARGVREMAGEPSPVAPARPLVG